MNKRSLKITLATLTGAAVVAGGTSAYALTTGSDSPKAAAQPVKAQEARQKRPAKPKQADAKAKTDPRLASGVSTATSFWDPETASGRPMAYRTIASPYWPLGTKVKITYKGQSKIGVVDDFGPAEWAVAQHNPPAIVDLSEKMMKDFTGSSENSVVIKFQVLELGKGGSYRHSGTGYKTATGK